MDINKKIKTLNVAWIGQGDFGDEVMAFILRKNLQGIGINKISYYEHGTEPVYTNNNDIKIKFIHKHNSSKTLKKIIDYFSVNKYNLLIFGGGSILHSVNSIKWKYNLVRKIKNNNPHTFIATVGVSIGPFQQPEKSSKLCSKFLNSTDIAILRDIASYKIAQKLSSNKNIFDSLDSSILIKKIAPEEIPPRDYNLKSQDLVGFIPVENKNWQRQFEQQRHFDKYLSIINHITSSGRQVRLFTHYTGSGYMDDKLVAALKQKSDNPRAISVYKFNHNIFDMIAELNKCGYLISMRLHGVIFSYILGIPFISLGYDPKNQNFCRSIKYPNEMCFNIWDLNQTKTLTNSFERLVQLKKSIFNNSMDLGQAILKVDQNFNKLNQKIKQKLL